MPALLCVFLLIVSCLFVSASELKPFFSKDFRFDHIEFPTELKQSSFNVRELHGKHFEQASEALFATAVRLKGLLDVSTNGGNFLVSPLSVASALGQLLLGAKGESRRKLSEMLFSSRQDGAKVNVPDLEYHQQFKTLLSLLENGTSPNESYDLQVASAFFLQQDVRLRADYRHAVNDLYGCEVIPLNFSADPLASQLTINNWVTRNTHGHITSVVPYPLPPSTVTLIANAIYFRGAWENPFDPDLTITGTFKINSRERVAVQYMRGQFELQYAESERLGCQMVVLPYKHKEASMHIFLPFDKDYDIRNFTAGLSINDVVELKRAAIERSVTLVMPKMSLRGSFSLKEPLNRFEKLRQKIPETTSTPKREVRPNFARSRGKRDTTEKEDTFIDTLLTSPSIKRKSDPLIHRLIRNVDVKSVPVSASAPRFETAERNETELSGKSDNRYYDFNNSSGRHQIPLASLDKADSNPEDLINTEIITSSIMVPALPLIVMEVDKTYTVGLNNSEFSNSAAEHFPPRQGEFDSMPIYQISAPSITNRNSPNNPVNNPRPNDKFQRPAQSSSLSTSQTVNYRPRNRIGSYGSQDYFSFPSLGSNKPPSSTTYTQPGNSFKSQANSPSVQNGNIPSSPSKEQSPFKPIPVGDFVNQQSAQDSQQNIDFDLTGASEDSRFRIDDILHEMWLEITESGTEAAAVSAGAVDYSGDVKLVLVDRPFVFSILHEVTRATLFWGAIVDPTAGSGQRTEGPLARPLSSTSDKQTPVIHSSGR